MGLTEAEIQQMIAKMHGEQEQPRVSRVKFVPLEPVLPKGNPQPVSFLGEINVTISAQLGEARMTVKEVLELQEGSVIELDKLAGEPVEVFVNDEPLALGEIVVINEVFGLRINSLVPDREQ